MALTIGSNIASLQAQRRLFESSSKLETVFERLASGQRINRASDDAAGLAISESLKTDQRVFTQGSRNLNDGLSLLNIADSTLEQLSEIVTRLNELAEQAANGTLGSQQRAALDEEAQSLSDEYTRIIRSTKFNGRNLFDGELGTLRFQGGYGLDGGVASGLGGGVGDGSLGSFFGTDLNSKQGLGISSGDFNGDGNIDFVVGEISNSNLGQISVYLGDGTGNFNESFSREVSTESIVDVKIGDLNGDGILDIVGVGSTSPNLVYLLGQGDGTFGETQTLPTLDEMTAVELADLNGDGALDILAFNAGGTVSTYFGTGSGEFSVEDVYVGLFPGTADLALGDINGDGVIDMAYGGGTSLVYRLGNGDGTFGSATTYNVGATLAQFEFEDFDGDGFDDLVYTSATHTGMLFGAGDGTLGNYKLVASGVSSALTVGDLDGDGSADLAIGEATDIVLFLGDGEGGFEEQNTYDSLGKGLSRLDLADVNNDGVLDVLGVGKSDITTGAVGVRFQNTTDGVAPLLEFDLSTLVGARQALPRFSNILDNLASQRGVIGAFQSRLASAGNVLSATTENYAAAESRIRDADIATEAASLVRLNILQQAGASVLSQANIQPELALQLLNSF